ncbi:hypothetical protein [Leucobacter chromiireducens]|uniref:hypothetical protein n=1 Tax=Leucobacter chromiireducens TaxID=283877 RepID=UPI0019277FF1|nr:hypothetical protein [Leucobacter chromiireducens]
MALSDFLETSKPAIFQRPRMNFDRVRLIDITAEFGAGTSTRFVRRLATRLGIDAVKDADGYLCFVREDVEVMKDWAKHHRDKIR